MNIVIQKIWDIVNKASEKMDFLNWVFGEQISKVLEGTPVVIFGTGNLGRDFLQALNNHDVNPVCFCNSSCETGEQSYQGLPVISIEELRNSHKSSLIVIASQTYAADIKKSLLNNGFHRDQIRWNKDFDLLTALYFAPVNQVTTGISSMFTSDEWIKILIQKQDSVLNGYNLLADQKSKDLFIAKIATMIAHKNLGLYREYMMKYSEAINEFGLICFQPYGAENYFYFNNDVFSLTENEIYMDIGAHDGDSVIEFVQTCLNKKINYKHIYAFEPDPVYFNALLEATKNYENISNHKLGIWSHSENLSFWSSENVRTDGASCIGNDGDIQIETISVDEFLGGKEISLLKMDPPGDIICNAIKGARNTITKHKPKLALGAYHSVEAIFEIPLLVNSICPEYKIYLRHNSWGIGETDLFALV